jgi:anti-sigma B factor antagonist
MEIAKSKENTKLTLTVSGRLDTTTSPKLEAELNAEIAGITELVFDFKDLDYISSAGLRILLTAQKTMAKQGAMKIIHVNETVMEVFEITGFADILTIE